MGPSVFFGIFVCNVDCIYIYYIYTYRCLARNIWDTSSCSVSCCYLFQWICYELGNCCDVEG